MAITRRSSSGAISDGHLSFASVGHSVPAPAGTQAGDVVLAFHAFSGDPFSITSEPPVGWTLVTSQTSNDGQIHVYRRTLSGPLGTEDWAVSTGAHFATILIAYTGVDTASPIDDFDGDTDTAVTSLAIPALTADEEARAVLAWSPDVSGEIVTSAGLDLAAYESDGSVAKVLFVFDDTVAATGAFGPKTGSWTTAESVQAVGVILHELNVAPNAPTLVAPLAGASVDLAAGQTFTATPSDNNLADTTSGWYLRRKIGAGAYEYWNVALNAWQSSEVKNPGPTPSVAFGSGKWSNGVTYQWSMATEDALGVKGPYASDRTVIGDTPSIVTVTAPTGSVTDDSRPQVEWSLSDVESNPQQTYQVIWETGAYGTTPGSGTEVEDTGELASVTKRYRTPTVDLANGVTHRAFVRIKSNGQYSAWAYTTFTISLTPPSAPTVTAVWDDVTNTVVFTITGTHANADFPATTFEIEYSPTGDEGTFATILDGIPGDGTPTPTPATASFRAAPSYKAGHYRARTRAEV